jgi:hypothetical protein
MVILKCIHYQISYNNTLDGLILLLVIPGYKASAKNTNKGTSFRYSCFFKFIRRRPTSAANAIGNLKDTHLADFFKRVAYKKGRATAVSATARKLAVIIWNMISKRVEYKAPTEYLFLDQKRKLRLVQNIKRNIAKFEIRPEDVGFVTA